MDDQLELVQLPMNIQRARVTGTHNSSMWCLLLACCIGTLNCPAEQSPEAFSTVSVLGDAEMSRTEAYARAAARASGTGPTGIYLRETLPAEEFAEGNWGELTDGIRLAVWLCDTNMEPKTNWKLGSPIHVATLIRNEGDSELRYATASGINYPVSLTLTQNGTGLTPRIPPLNKSLHDGSMGTLRVPPRSQNRHMFRLDKMYDLSRPGEYEVLAEFKKKTWSAESGVARFSLTISPETDQSTGSTPPREEATISGTNEGGSN